MIKIPLSSTEVKKFHNILFERALEELRKSDTKHKKAKPDKIEWCYSYEVVSDHAAADARVLRKDVDQKIRKAKLDRLADVSKAAAWKKAAPPKPSTESISQHMKNFFDNVITLSLMMKVENYERFYTIEKTSLFESKIKEDIESGTFVF